jgi:hypothetical protein
MNYKLRIYFPMLTAAFPDFEREYITVSLRDAVTEANNFLVKTSSRLLSYTQKTIIGFEHVEAGVIEQGSFSIAICPQNGTSPIQIMEFSRTMQSDFGERLINVATPKTTTTMESRTKNQDTLKQTLDSVPNFNANDIVLLKQQVELAQKERDRNLRYAAIDKMQDIRDRYTNTHSFVPAVESMFDEMLGAIMNLRS